MAVSVFPSQYTNTHPEGMDTQQIDQAPVYQLRPNMSSQQLILEKQTLYDYIINKVQ